eukprot:UN01715
MLFLLTYLSANLALMIALKVSMEFYVPLRPVLFISRNSRVSHTLITFYNSFIGAIDVVCMYVSLIIVMSISALVLYKDDINVDSETNSFVDISASVITTFVFISTGENYNELVYEAMDKRCECIYIYRCDNDRNVLYYANIYSTFRKCFSGAFKPLEKLSKKLKT